MFLHFCLNRKLPEDRKVTKYLKRRIKKRRPIVVSFFFVKFVEVNTQSALKLTKIQ